MNVLVVCRANVCRSRVAEALLQEPLSRLGAEVSSAGVLAAGPGVVCRESINYARAHCVAVSTALPPRQLTRSMIESAGLIVTTDHAVTSFVAELCPSARSYTFPLTWAASAMANVARLVARHEVPSGAPPVFTAAGSDARWAWLVDELDASRGSLHAVRSPDGFSVEEVLDPHAGELSHPEAFQRISSACEQIVASAGIIVGAPPFTPEGPVSSTHDA